MNETTRSTGAERDAALRPDVRARFAAAARQRTAIDVEIAARSDAEISTRLHYVALYFEMIGWGGLLLSLAVWLLFPHVVALGLGETHVSFASRAAGLATAVVVYGGYAANGWLLRRRRRVGAYGALATLGVAVLRASTMHPFHPTALLLPLLGAAALLSVWNETE